MSGRAIEAGRAFLKLLVDDEEMRKGFDKAMADIEARGKVAMRIGAQMGAIGAVITAPFIASLKVASDAQESLSKFGAIFGDQAKAAGAWADQTATAIGRASTDIKNGLSAFQGFFVGLGFDPSKAREMSQSIQQMSLDFASFHNLSDEESMDRFISALSGSSEVLDRFGINIKEAAIEQQLLGMGIAKSSAAASEQEKVMARIGIIIKAMTDQGAMGDAVRTADSFANKSKAASASLKSLAEAMGTAILPVASLVAGAITDIVTPMAIIAKNNPELLAAVALTGGALTGLSVIVASVGGAFTYASVAAAGFRAALSLLAAHPYLVAATVLLTGATALWLKYRDLGEAVEETAEATAEQVSIEAKLAAGQQQLTSAMDGGTKAVDARTEALNRLSAAEQAAVKRSENATRAEEVAQNEAELKRKARIQTLKDEIESRKRLIANIESGQTPRIYADDEKYLKMGVTRRQRELADLMYAGLEVPGPGGGTAFPMALQPGVVQFQQNARAIENMQKMFAASIAGMLNPTGMMGQRAVKNVAEQVRPITATYSGRLAGQIFGAGRSTEERDRKEIIKLNKEQRDYQKQIARKTFVARTDTRV